MNIDPLTFDGVGLGPHIASTRLDCEEMSPLRSIVDLVR
jgi:hypothetical protein